MIAISSPYARRGALWETYKRNFGPEGDPAILVARGPRETSTPSCLSRSSTEPWSEMQRQRLPSTSLNSEPTSRAS